MIRDRIQKLQLKGNADQAVSSIVTVMKEMGWSWEEAMNTPIPSYLVILDELAKNAKKEAEQMKKGKHK